ARLLREAPVEAGVSPGFTECDERTDEALRHQAFRRALEGAEGAALLRELSRSGIQPEDLLGALDTVCDHGEVEFPVVEVEPPSVEPIWEEVDRFARGLDALLPQPLDPQTSCGIQQKGRRFLERWRTADRFRLFGLIQMLLDWEREPYMVLKYWARTRDEQYAVKERLDSLIERFRTRAVLPFLEQWRGHLYGQSVSFLMRVRGEYAEERRRLGMLNFNDLLVRAARLLRQHASVRERLQSRFRWLFVDEFQDTDPVQAEVLLLLAAVEGQVESDWTRVTLRPGALFIVGDPKQSIYRFRRADIQTCSAVKARMDDTVTLAASFRTLPHLCEWTNRVFAELLPEQATERQAAFSPLVPVRQGQGRVALLWQTCPRYQDAAACEADRIADWISRSQRRWADFMILTFKRDDLSLYAQALERRGIPVEVTGGRARNMELAEALLELLGVLGDPHDQVGLVGVLRGPLFGLDDDRLFRHREAGGAFTWWTGPGEPSVNEALAMLQAMRDRIRVLPVGAAVEQVLEETGLIALAASRPGGQAEAAELMLVADQVRELGLQGLTLPDAIREVRLNQSEQPPSLACGRSDVVRVMNLHKAKGLEAPVVFLASPTGGAPVRADLRIVRTGARAEGFLSIRNRWQTFAQPQDWPQHEWVELEFLREERTRLLYVAATRARDMLVVGRWSGTHGGAQRPWAAFDPFLGEAEELGPFSPHSPDGAPVAASDTLADLVVGDPSPACGSTAERLAAARARWQEERGKARVPTWTRTSVLACQEEEGGLRAWTPPVPPQVQAGERPDSAAIWGDLIHRLLERLVRDPDLGREQLERLARWFLFETPEMAEFIPLALDTLDQVRETGFWRRAMEASRRLVEVPFGVLDGGRYVFGVLDLALERPEGWELVDYKTGQGSVRELVKRHAGQIQRYAHHWAQLAAEPVIYAGIFSVRKGELSQDLRSSSGHSAETSRTQVGNPPLTRPVDHGVRRADRNAPDEESL
ncbi:MAG: UvrD-helicase domain-containing protein, partial [Candidatus Eremiobacterota bacterium]